MEPTKELTTSTARGMRGKPTINQILVFGLLLLLFAVLSMWASMFIHEALGHCLFSQLLCGMAYGFHIDVMFYGYSDVAQAEFPLPIQFVLIRLGGLIANLCFAIAVYIHLITALKKKHMRRQWLLLLSVFLMFPALNEIGYAFLGYVYGFGDSPIVREHASSFVKHLWVPLLLPVPFVTYFLGVAYIRVQSLFFSIDSPRVRIKLFILTTGSVAALFLSSYVVVLYPEIVEFLSRSHAEELLIKLLPGAAFFYLACAGILLACWRTNATGDDTHALLSSKDLIWPAVIVVLTGVVLVAGGGDYRWPRFGAGLPQCNARIVDEKIADDLVGFFDVDNDGDIYFVDADEGTLGRYDPKAAKKTILLSQLREPVLLDATSNLLYILVDPLSSDNDELKKDLMCYETRSAKSSRIRTVAINAWLDLSPSHIIVVGHDHQLLTISDRCLVTLPEEGETPTLFAALPDDVEGEILSAAVGRDGTIYVAAGEACPNENTTLLRCASDLKTFTAIAAKLSRVRAMDCDPNGTVYLAGEGWSSIMVVAPNVAAADRYSACQIQDGWKKKVLSLACPKPGTVYYQMSGDDGLSLHRLTMEKNGNS